MVSNLMRPETANRMPTIEQTDFSGRQVRVRARPPQQERYGGDMEPLIPADGGRMPLLIVLDKTPDETRKKLDETKSCPQDKTTGRNPL